MSIYSNIKHGDFIEITNKETQDIMVRGCVVIMKHNPEELNLPIDILVSTDYKYFFTLKENPLFIIEKTKFSNDIVNFDYKKYNNYIFPYVIQENNIPFDIEKAFIFREHDMTELDSEIAPLVYALNEAGYETTGSCCGHGKDRAWIGINFKDFNSLVFLFDILNKDRFRFEFELETNSNDINIKSGEIRLSLKTLTKGKKAYENIKELADYINYVKKKNDFKC